MTRYRLLLTAFLSALATLILWVPTPESWGGDDNDDDIPLGAATVIIELTDNDIELQAFVDGSPSWNRFTIYDPKEKRIFDMKTRGKLQKAGHERAVLRLQPGPLCRGRTERRS